MTHRQTMSPRFASPCVVKDDPDRIRGAITGHVSRRQQRLPGYLGGPFQVRTGG